MVLIPLLAPFTLPLALSALVMGAFTPGMPSLILGRLAEINAGRDQHGAWGLATTVYALAQAGGAYLMSWLYARSHGYDALFEAGAMALAAALALSLASARGRRRGLERILREHRVDPAAPGLVEALELLLGRASGPRRRSAPGGPR